MQPLWKGVFQIPQKTWNGLPFDPVIPLLGLYPKDVKSAYCSNTATTKFITAQFTIARLWNQPRCPSTDEWINKLWYIHTMEYDSAINKKNIKAFANKWMDLENIVLSEISQSHKKPKAECFP